MAINDYIDIDRSAEQLEEAIDVASGATGIGATKIGKQAQATAEHATAVGTGAQATDTAAIAIGAQAQCSGENAIQIGYGSNPNDDTVKIKSTTILDADGKIPFSALKGGEVVGVSVNSSNHLIVTYANGATADLGAIGGGGGTSDYEQLTNKPTLNGETIQGSMEVNTFETNSTKYVMSFSMINGAPCLVCTELGGANDA